MNQVAPSAYNCGAMTTWVHVNGSVPARVVETQVGEWMAPATSLPHRSKQSRGTVGAASQIGCDVIPVYRGSAHFPKGKSGAVLNLKRAETEGSCYIAASIPVNGPVPVL